MQTNFLTCSALTLILSLRPIMDHRRHVNPNERSTSPFLVEAPIERRANLPQISVRCVILQPSREQMPFRKSVSQRIPI